MKIIKNKNLTKLNTFGIKSVAEYFCEPKKENEFLEAIQWAIENKKQWNVIGGGSNIVCPEKIKGLVIKVDGGKTKISNGKVIADAGIPLDQFIRFVIKNGYKGIEMLSGIPGTLGGAIIGNAGAYGGSISDYIVRVRVLCDGKVKWISKKDCKFGYRESALKHSPCVLLYAEFRFKKGDPKELSTISKKIINTRNKKYSPKIKCPGSYFKNIQISKVSPSVLKKVDASKIIDGKIPVGYILESVGAKGISCGGMCVADFHANCIVNMKNGTAKDAKSIAKLLKKKVLKHFDISLEEEVRYL